MAEFCKQCAEELGFPESDFQGIPWEPVAEPLKDDEGYQVLCEGCGFTLVKSDGTCITNCFHNHNPESKYHNRQEY